MLASWLGYGAGCGDFGQRPSHVCTSVWPVREALYAAQMGSDSWGRANALCVVAPQVSGPWPRLMPLLVVIASLPTCVSTVLPFSITVAVQHARSQGTLREVVASPQSPGAGTC